MTRAKLRHLWTAFLCGLLWLPGWAEPTAQEPWKLPPRPPERPSGVRQMTLQETIELGLAQNPQMQIAAERVEQARASYLQSRSQKVPKLVLTNTTRVQPETSINTGGLLRNLPPGPLSAGFPDRFVLMSPVTNEFQLSLQVLLTTFGRVENQIAAAFLQIDAEGAAADVDRLNLTYAIKRASFAKLQADATVEVTRQNLAVANQTLEDTRALFEQGVMSRYDILQAEIEVTNAVQGLSQNLTDVDTASASLASLLAERRFHIQPLPPEPLVIAPEVELPALEEFALRHRPEILSIAYNRAVAQKLLDAAYGESNPSVILAANYQTHFGQSLSPIDLPSLNLQIQWSIFDGGWRKARVQEAESVLRQIEAMESQQTLSILQQVETAWLNLKQTAFTLASAEKQLANATEYHDMARRRYINGLATTLEVAESLRNLVAARSGVVAAQYQRDLAFAQLEQSLGQDAPERRLTLEFLQSPSLEGTSRGEDDV